MLRYLRFLVLGVGLLVLAIVVIGAFMPGSWSADSSRVLRAPPERVQAALEDLHTWPEWTHWSTAIDGSAKLTFDGPPRGVGARMSWEGQILGFGSITLLAALPRGGETQPASGATPPAGGVEYEIAMAGIDGVTRGSIVLEADPLGTRATRREGAELGWNPMMRLFSPLLAAKLRRDFDAGFEKLARVVEAPR